MQCVPLFPFLAGHAVGILTEWFGVSLHYNVIIASSIVSLQFESLTLSFIKKHQAIAIILKTHIVPNFLLFYFYFCCLITPLLVTVCVNVVYEQKDEQFSYIAEPPFFNMLKLGRKKLPNPIDYPDPNTKKPKTTTPVVPKDYYIYQDHYEFGSVETTTEPFWKDYYFDPGYDYITDEFQKDNTVFDGYVETFKFIYDISSFIAFFVNIFHMIVLTRKELRTQLVYIIMIGISLCDIFQSLGNVTQVVMMWNIIYKIEGCWGGVICEYDSKIPPYVPYRMVAVEKWERKYLAIDGFMAMLISCTYFAVAIILLVAVSKAKERRKKLRSDASSNTFWLVLVMTISVFLSEITYGAYYITDYFYVQYYKEQEVYQELDAFSYTLLIVNSVTHCLICFLMSSQYRDQEPSASQVNVDDTEFNVTPVAIPLFPVGFVP
ncbi:hypothetical protein GCK72_020633 [Caenorhabditis remanei]|uniref:G-protein coupled receptors family 1 profile domain-containing protein n=1 Tax=Caenorhabditis remanei TaxID=31234 RepID=A0A6A5GHP1_CAERE|nr:hypothetical protein GCK72_020633 [Caenorhabditis remanei]KAF1754075.1 hypothetical protein GCK72_020633 [Caenorhabditis remanei]